MSGTLYTYPENFRAWKAQVAAEYSGFDLKVDQSFKYGETNTTAEFKNKFPLGKVPALESSDGLCLNESNAIARFVANEALLGSSKVDQCKVTQWMNFAESEILPAVCTWVFPCMGIMQYNKQNTERSKSELREILEVLNNELVTRTFLVGERASLADLSVASYLLLAYKWVLEPSFREPYQNVNRWFQTVVNQTQFKKIVPEVTLCEKMAQFDAKKYAEIAGNKKDKKDKKKEDKPPGKTEAKPKEQPKEDEAAAAPAEEKKKDPFLQFPPSETFVLDEWKKTWTNEDLEVSIPWFMKNFDAEKYTVWLGRYKYTSEIPSLSYMANNLLNGMIQRLDGLRKYGFGVHLLLEIPDSDGAKDFAALYIARCPTLPFEISPDLCVDSVGYEWNQLDFKDPKAEETIKIFWSCEGVFDGKTVMNYRDFK